jgi:hypothetical protein
MSSTAEGTMPAISYTPSTAQQTRLGMFVEPEEMMLNDDLALAPPITTDANAGLRERMSVFNLDLPDGQLLLYDQRLKDPEFVLFPKLPLELRQESGLSQYHSIVLCKSSTIISTILVSSAPPRIP